MKIKHKFTTLRKTLILVLILSSLSGCSGKRKHPEFDQYLSQENYKAAYEYCLVQLNENPQDENFLKHLKVIEAKLHDSAIAEGSFLMEKKRFLSARDSFNKAMKYRKESLAAKESLKKATASYEKIRDLYSQAVNQKDHGELLKALKTLTSVANGYDYRGDRTDEMGIGDNLKTWHLKAFNHFVSQGNEARRKGAYSAYLEAFKSAVFIQNLPHAPEALKIDNKAAIHLKLAKKYVEADRLFKEARKKQVSGEPIKMMECLTQARNIIDGHLNLNLFYAEILPAWSDGIFSRSLGFVSDSRFEGAVSQLKMLCRVNPDYPGAKELLEEARNKYLLHYYRLMIQAQTDAKLTNDFQSVLDCGKKIRREDPDFLDTTDIISRVSMEAFGIFYRKGIRFRDNMEYAKAVMCFISAESFTGKNQLTTLLIDEMLEKIRVSTRKDMAIWNFDQDVGDIRTGFYTASLLRNRLLETTRNRKFKNINLHMNPLEFDLQINNSAYSGDGFFDWDLFKSRGNSQNSLVTGTIKLLNIERSKSTQWKEWKHERERYNINPAFAKLDQRQARLYRLLGNKRELVKSGKSASEVKKELKEVRAIIQATPQMIREKEIIITPYQEEKHRIEVSTRMEVRILRESQGLTSGTLWDKVEFNDTLVVEDTVVPPDVKATDPVKRTGDPLDLPTDYEMKQKAISRMVSSKIVPYLQEKINDYGINYYQEGALEGISASSRIKNYFRFLACYDEKYSSHPEHIQEVKDYIEENIAGLWLIHN